VSALGRAAAGSGPTTVRLAGRLLPEVQNLCLHQDELRPIGLRLPPRRKARSCGVAEAASAGRAGRLFGRRYIRRSVVLGGGPRAPPTRGVGLVRCQNDLAAIRRYRVPAGAGSPPSRRTDADRRVDGPASDLASCPIRRGGSAGHDPVSVRSRAAGIGGASGWNPGTFRKGARKGRNEKGALPESRCALSRAAWGLEITPALYLCREIPRLGRRYTYLSIALDDADTPRASCAQRGLGALSGSGDGAQGGSAAGAES